MAPKKFSRFYVGQSVRRGRSHDCFGFVNQVLGRPVRSQQPYALCDALMHENELVVRREDDDEVYRGEVRREDSMAYYALTQTVHLPDISDGDEEEEVDELTDRSSPSPTSEHSGTVALLFPASPATSATQYALSSPRSPRIFTKTYVPSPTVSDYAPAPPRLVTYSARDRKNYGPRKAHAARDHEASHKAQKVVLARKRAAIRRSVRLNPNFVDARHFGVWSAEKLIRMGHVLHKRDWQSLTPLIDSREYVMGVIAGAPQGDLTWWNQHVQHAAQAMTRLLRLGHFDPLVDEESHVRFGLGFGQHGAVPYYILPKSVHQREISFIERSGGFKVIAAYQNHILSQVAPKLFAHQRLCVERLEHISNKKVPYRDSAFTTCEISFGDGPDLSRKNIDSTFYTMEAVTICGTWENEAGIVFWDDGAVLALRGGNTVVFPSGTKRISFGSVGANETRFFFRQFFSAGLMRWMEKGGRTDAVFDIDATSEEKTPLSNCEHLILDSSDLTWDSRGFQPLVLDNDS
ncbi:hypothetical protein B0H15DRAFT_797821 [Mycena belliarum]|uniref:Uncharacterized protein n=1 Tax=Mycena belliarum TaxID=1033014 RepID=A0AAD6UFN7_9AGAR|nr:hypothetical protein B0H15DRAFT_797821 [Mycena belliae]